MESNQVWGPVDRLLCFIDDMENVYPRLGTPEAPSSSVTLTHFEVNMLGCLLNGAVSDALQSGDPRLLCLLTRLWKMRDGG